MTKLEKTLRGLGACAEARTWTKGRKPEAAWNECHRGDWMLWVAAKAGVDRRVVVLAACACARLALRHVPEGETRPRRSIETAEAWARGEAGVTLDDVHKAADAAYAAYAAYAADATAYAADAAAYAARAATLAECANVVRQHIKLEVVLAALEKSRTPAEVTPAS